MQIVRRISFLAVIALVVSLSSCSGILGSSIPAGTYVLTTDNGVWTLELGKGTFDYTQESSTGTLLVAYRGEFDALDGEGDDIYEGTLTKLEESADGTTYTEIDVTAGTHTIYLSWYSSTKVVSFKLDGDGDGSYSSFNPDDVVVTTNIVDGEITGLQLQ